MCVCVSVCVCVWGGDGGGVDEEGSRVFASKALVLANMNGHVSHMVTVIS